MPHGRRRCGGARRRLLSLYLKRAAHFVDLLFSGFIAVFKTPPCDADRIYDNDHAARSRLRAHLRPLRLPPWARRRRSRRAARSSPAQFSIRTFLYSAALSATAAIRWRISAAGLRPLFRIGQDLAIRTGALRLSLIFATVPRAYGAATLSAYEIVFQLFMLAPMSSTAWPSRQALRRNIRIRRRIRAHRMG